MKKLLVLILIIAIILSLPINAAPGDNSDPIVVLSYLNQRLKEYDKTIAELNEKIKNTSAGSNSLDVVTLEPGQKLIAEAGTEIILRGGKVTAIASELGGLSDVTLATDIINGAEVAANHLLIVPRSDGRGVYSANGAILIVRGVYKVVSQ